jgi:hypothetical protein
MVTKGNRERGYEPQEPMASRKDGRQPPADKALADTVEARQRNKATAVVEEITSHV